MNSALECFVTDTMALVLWIEKRKMPATVKSLFTKAENNLVKLYIPGMVLAEIGYLSERNRIDITLTDVSVQLKKYNNVVVHPMDLEVVRTAFEIKDIAELHDRLIAATGRLLAYPVITNDPVIIASEFVSTVWG